MTAHEQNIFQLAENLGMTVSRMTAEMSLREYVGWMIFYSERNAAAEREAKKKPKPQRPKNGEVILRGFDL